MIYYFLPLFIAGTLLVLKDFYQHRSKLIQAEKLATRIIPSVVPQIFALFLFLSGAYLLISGALPTLPNNLHWLSNFIPLPVLELSHLMGSLVGVLLLFLARGIYLKLDAAWYGALILLALAILSSVLTASGWVKVVALLIIFVCILISHRYFYRKSSLFELSPEPFWLISIVLVVAGSTWLGFLPIIMLSTLMIYGGSFPIKTMFHDFTFIYRNCSTSSCNIYLAIIWNFPT